MADPKHPFLSRPPAQTATPPKGERRRTSRIVHDHKGTAIVQWHDAPADYERPVLEIEGAGPLAKPTGLNAPAGPNTPTGLNTGSLSIQSDENSHNPYMHIPGADRKRAPGDRTRTDLRKLSAWIKLMRELEEAKKRKRDDNEDED